MDREDLHALRRRRQVDEEELVEAAAAQELGREPRTSFAVATTNTGDFFSAIHVRNEPKVRVALASASVAAKPFSIVSIQSTTGASDSATTIASRIASSGLRVGSPNAAARSARSSGNCHSRATAFAQSDSP